MSALPWEWSVGDPVWVRFGTIGCRPALIERITPKRIRVSFLVAHPGRKGGWRQGWELLPRFTNTRPSKRDWDGRVRP